MSSISTLAHLTPLISETGTNSRAVPSSGSTREAYVGLATVTLTLFWSGVGSGGGVIAGLCSSGWPVGNCSGLAGGPVWALGRPLFPPLAMALSCLG